MNTVYLATSLLSLLAAGFWAVLFAASRETGNAGVLRLIDKRPQAKHIIDRWARRWSVTESWCVSIPDGPRNL